MAFLFADSFDVYANATDITSGGWDTSTGANAGVSSTTRFTLGQSFHPNGANSATKFLHATDTVMYVAFARMCNSAPGGSSTKVKDYFQILDSGGSIVLTVSWMDDNSLQVGAGTVNSSTTVLSSSLVTFASAWTQSIWDHWQFKITKDGGSGGRVEVRKNGATTNTYDTTATAGLDGGASIIVAGGGVGSSGSYFDDIFINDSTGGDTNSWPGDIRCITLLPNADTATKAFSPTPATATFGQTTNNSTTAKSANTQYAEKFTTGTTQVGTIASVTVNLNAGFTGNMKAAIYADSSGAPGTLLATSNAQVNPTSGDNVITFGSPPSVVQSTPYWIALLADTAFTPTDSTTTTTQYTSAQTYGSGFQSPWSGSTNASAHTIRMNAQITLSNTANVSEATENGDTSYVASSNVNDEDLYSVQSLSGSPTILGVQTRLYARKDDAGTRSLELVVKSGATTVTGTDTGLATSYVWQNRMDTLDPNTSAAWTASNVNALNIGMKVTA